MPPTVRLLEPLCVAGVDRLQTVRRYNRRSPVGVNSPLRSTNVVTDKAYKVTGLTKDATGALLGNCIVRLFYSDTDTLAAVTESDASGNYTFSVGPNLDLWIAWYKDGATPVGGTSLRTLRSA